MVGNRCASRNAYYSQCVADSSKYLPASSGCVASFSSPCNSLSTCCDPGQLAVLSLHLAPVQLTILNDLGAVCTAIAGGTAICKPIEAPSCQQPEGFNIRYFSEDFIGHILTSNNFIGMMSIIFIL